MQHVMITAHRAPTHYRARQIQRLVKDFSRAIPQNSRPNMAWFQTWIKVDYCYSTEN